jgi:WD40 repeat protein
MRGEEVADLPGLDSGSSAIFDADGDLPTCGPLGLHRWPVRPSDRTEAAGAWRVGPAEVLLTVDLGGARVARSEDGRMLAVTCFDAGALVWHRDRPRLAVRLGPQRDVRQVAVNPDGRWVATGSWNGTNEGVFVWDAATGHRTR